MPSSRGSSQLRDQTHIFMSLCLLCLLCLHWQAGSLPLVPPGKPPYMTVCRIRRPLKCKKIHSVLLPILLLPLTPIECHLKTIPKKKINKEDLYSVLLFPLCIEINVSIMWAVLVVVCCLVTKSFLRLWDPMDCSSPVSSVHGFPLLECVAFSVSRGSSWPRGHTRKRS